MKRLTIDIIFLVAGVVTVLLLMSFLSCSTAPRCKSFEDSNKWCNPPRTYQPEHRR